MLSIWQRTAHLMAAKMQKKRQEEARLPMSPSRSHSCDHRENNETTYESKLGPEWNI
jgi:hypothetical protein